MRDNNEKSVAIREFKEETNIKDDCLKFLEEPSKLSEEYKSYDNIKYKNTYYIAEYTSSKTTFITDIKNKEQFTEVSNIDFFSLEECKKIRNYSQSKIDLLINLENILNKLNNEYTTNSQ